MYNKNVIIQCYDIVITCILSDIDCVCLICMICMILYDIDYYYYSCSIYVATLYVDCSPVTACRLLACLACACKAVINRTTAKVPIERVV